MTRHPEWLTLEGDETVVWSGQPRLMSTAGTVVGAVVGTAVLVGLVVALGQGYVDRLLPASVGPFPLPSIASAVPTAAVLGVSALAVAWGLTRVAWAYLVVTNVDYVLTDRNLYEKTGVFSETVTRVGLDRVQSTSLAKDALGNLFDYGSVAVSTAGGSGVEMVARDLDAPGELQSELRRLVNEAGGSPTGGGTAPAAGVSDEVLRELLAEARQLRETTAAVEEVLEG